MVCGRGAHVSNVKHPRGVLQKEPERTKRNRHEALHAPEFEVPAVEGLNSGRVGRQVYEWGVYGVDPVRRSRAERFVDRGWAQRIDKDKHGNQPKNTAGVLFGVRGLVRHVYLICAFVGGVKGRDD